MHFMDGVAAEDRGSDVGDELLPSVLDGPDGLGLYPWVSQKPTGSFSRALEAGLSYDEYRDARSGLS